MALKCNFSYKGIEVKGGIIKVIRFDGRKTDVGFTVGYYSNNDSELIFCSEHSLHYKLDGGNIMEQAYAYLKTLTEFSDAVDC